MLYFYDSHRHKHSALTGVRGGAEVVGRADGAQGRGVEVGGGVGLGVLGVLVTGGPVPASVCSGVWCSGELS